MVRRLLDAFLKLSGRSSPGLWSSWPRAARVWGFGVLGFGVLGFRVLGFWGLGVLGFWSFGVLVFWVLGFRL